MNTTMLIIGLVILLGIVVMVYYNKLVRLKNKVEESWSGIDVQLKRRHDLIPNLMESVKGYAGHEKGIFEKLAMARNQAISADTVAGQADAENMITQSLKSLFAVAENYPDLKASENFRQFQQELSTVEDEIQLARRYYNANTRDFNTSVETFPGVLLAGPMNFVKYDYFEIDYAEKAAPKVKF